MVTFAASVLALVTRVRMKVSIWGHQASIFLRSRWFQALRHQTTDRVAHRQRLSYSVGFTLPANTPDLLAKIPKNGWTPAYDAHDQVHDGAWVAEPRSTDEVFAAG